MDVGLFLAGGSRSDQGLPVPQRRLAGLTEFGPEDLGRGTQRRGVAGLGSSSWRSGWPRQLRSVELARQFVSRVVVPRVRRGKAIAIVARKANLWGLPDLPGIVRYTAGEARGAHLTPNSRGGRLILERLAEVTRRSRGSV